MTAARVVLLRHGRTAENHRGIWQGRLDSVLDDVGRSQASAAADALADALSGWDPVRLVASPLRRARATAQYVADAAGLPVTEDERLREVDVGRWQGRTHDEIAAGDDAEALAAWTNDEDVPAGGGELRSEVARRGAVAVREHADAQDGGVLVVASHGALIRGATLDLLGLAAGGWRLLSGVGNCHWVELEPREPVWRLVAYNVSAGPGLMPAHPRRTAPAVTAQAP